MKSKKTKKKVRLDSHSSASIFLAFTVICFMFTMLMASNQVSVSYAAPTDSVPQTLVFSGETFAGTGKDWLFIVRNDASNQDTDPKLFLSYDFKAKDQTSNTQYEMYCIDKQNATLGSVGSYYDLDGELDPTYAPGLAYILNNSYPLSSTALSFCNDKQGIVNGNAGIYPTQCKKYTTQYAVWYYLDKMKNFSGVSQLTAAEMEKINFAANPANASSGAYYEVAAQVKKLAEAAIDYNSKQQTATTISVDKNNVQYHVTEDGKFLESNEITVTSNKVLNNYSVGFKSNNCNAKIIDVAGNENSVFNNGSKFKVRIPVEKLDTLETVDLVITITGSYTTDTVWAYKLRTNPNAQRPIIPSHTKKVANISITLDTKLVRVIKTDKETGKPVIGAVLAIMGADGNEITRFTTAEDPHYLNLAVGNYILKEISSPEGYELSSEEIPFTVTEDSTINEVEMKNTPTIKVPDTASSIPAYLYIIGSMILIIGLSVIVITTKQSKSN